MEEKETKKECKLKIVNNSNSFILCVIWIVLFVGFFSGVLYSYFGSNLKFLNDYFETFFQKKITTDVMHLFLLNSISIMGYLLSVFLLGFSPIFSLAISLIPFLKGLGIGLNISYIYTSYQWKGLVYEAITDIPINIMVMFVVVLATKEALKFSDGIYKTIRHKKNNDISLKRYTIKFIVIFVLAIIVSFLSSVANYLFFRYFTLF